MSIEDDIARAFNETIESIQNLEDRVDILDRHLEILAGALRLAGVITEKHIVDAKRELVGQEEELQRRRKEKYNAHRNIFGNDLDSFLRSIE